MRHNERIAGFDGLHRFGATKNYHVADKNGRAYFCGCFKNIWVTTTHGNRRRKTPSSMKVLKGSKKNHLAQWHRQSIFERNLDRITNARVQQTMETTCWEGWNVVGDVWILGNQSDLQ